MNLKLDRDYEVKCTLGTIRELEQKFGCSFAELIAKLNDLSTEDRLAMLYAGVRRAEPNLGWDRFLALCDESLGLGALSDKLEEFVYQLQYPGKSQEEIEEIVQKKLAKAGKINRSIGTDLSAPAPAQG